MSTILRPLSRPAHDRHPVPRLRGTRVRPAPVSLRWRTSPARLVVVNSPDRRAGCGPSAAGRRLMPWAAWRRCLEPGCRERQDASRCLAHQRVTRQARGYDAAWQAVRLVVLGRDGGRCQIRGPRCRGRADTVDHIVPLAWAGPRLDLANLRAACAPCNDGRPRTPRPLEPGGRSVSATDAPGLGPLQRRVVAAGFRASGSSHVRPQAPPSAGVAR